MVTEAQRAATKRYDKANTRRIALKLNISTDADILAFLDASTNKQGAIKKAIREQIKRTSNR